MSELAGKSYSLFLKNSLRVPIAQHNLTCASCVAERVSILPKSQADPSLQGDWCLHLWIGSIRIRLIELSNEFGKFLLFRRAGMHLLQYLEDKWLPMEIVILWLLQGQAKHYTERFSPVFCKLSRDQPKCLCSEVSQLMGHCKWRSPLTVSYQKVPWTNKLAKCRGVNAEDVSGEHLPKQTQRGKAKS